MIVTLTTKMELLIKKRRVEGNNETKFKQIVWA